jgi:hypothetical protein
LDFRMEFLMRYVHIVVIVQGGVLIRRKEEGGISILVRLYVGSYQTLRPWQDYIYTWELYVVIINI